MQFLILTFLANSIPGFNGSEDSIALEQLLEGFDQQDQDQVFAICNSALFKYMDNDVSLVNYFEQPDIEMHDRGDHTTTSDCHIIQHRSDFSQL